MKCNKCGSLNLINAGIENTSKGKKARIKCKDCGKIMITIPEIAKCPSCGVNVRVGSTHGKISTDFKTYHELNPCPMSGKFWDEKKVN